MKRQLWARALLAIGLTSGAAHGTQGDWLGCARVININPLLFGIGVGMKF
jgi:hypothetical protein